MKFDGIMMQTALLFASKSYCKRKKVGAVVAKEGRILITGYNGTVTGMDNTCEDRDGYTNEFTVHAEQNAICFAAKNGIALNDTTMYITISPCKHCAKIIAQSGINEVVYNEEYKDTEGIDFLKECGIKVRKMGE